ncbi:glycosyl transferase [Leptospira sp. 2 VSF19]|uniref:Glycosyl transferase n=1 Tax=Leptospira soteropolitanensis TaxID=2950025 RepID=A0AAW5VI09_9LEPT|nr:glycosyl transferase [Leptospira soteropolitanensis]MCW7493161.1 glycosyl transferase [Leptospira soteropolitanensis]MCW7500770.1 glycosyl transferase [Leptospira soteropolitanensis]MCW7523011.1 glycosyl transferase [Leptospira soteropolitanensis]MCW7526882.1 glycosyl transferase [Leptospira soteropolitanensis]MCW7530729.1 glycosyl transferase [Leptospira soteropolitanensis]
MILIFTEALVSTGLGHLGRCTALAEKLIENGKNVRLVVHTDESFPNWDFPCKILKKVWTSETDLNGFLENLPDKGQIFYVDSYLAPLNIYNILKSYCLELICIDDDNRLNYPAGSTILNPGYPGLFLGYDKEKYKIVTGKDQVLLRKPFRTVLSIQQKKKPPEKILITLGGSDPNKLSTKILEILVNKFPKIEKHLVIGPGFINALELKNLSDQKTYFYKNLNAEKMCELMLNVDFAITAGGQTTYELDRCGVPMIVIETAENQKNNIKGFVEFQGVREIKKDQLERIGEFL